MPPDDTILAHKFLAGVNVTLRLERSVVDSADSFTGDTWLEQHFSVMETFSADSDDVYVSEIVVFSLSVSAIDVSTVS